MMNQTESKRAIGIPPKIAMINDIAGFGRCSTTVALPVISAMKAQVCPVPTSIFSNHTGFPIHFMKDCTAWLSSYLEKWEELNLHFDGIYCGYLGCSEQIAVVEDFIRSQKSDPPSKGLPETASPAPRSPVIIIDPVMGDHGKAYRTVTSKLCHEMRLLIRLADIITPNITEACLLTDLPYRETGWTPQELLSMTDLLHKAGPRKIVITGLREGTDFLNYVSDASTGERTLSRTEAAGPSRPGTGDIFASIISADAVNGTPFKASVEKASAFIRTCTKASADLNIPINEGVCFENFLSQLIS